MFIISYQQSDEQNGFKAFVYMHRWTAGAISRVRALYQHKVQEKYKNEIRAIDAMTSSMPDNRMIAREENRKKKLKKQIAEVKEYDEIQLSKTRSVYAHDCICILAFKCLVI